MTTFVPTRDDVHSARTLLASRKLPNELILDILDLAHYWVERQSETTVRIALGEGQGADTFSAAYPYIGISAFPSRDDWGSEPSKIREIEFIIVSHDQGWSIRPNDGSFDTCSWVEVSILRPDTPPTSDRAYTHVHHQLNFMPPVKSNIYEAKDAILPSSSGIQLVSRPNFVGVETHRLHTPEMMYVVDEKLREEEDHQEYAGMKEGEHAWFLQGNQVAEKVSVFEGEMVKRYRVVWGSKAAPNWIGNDGTGLGEGFVDLLQEDDWICVWARVKGQFWQNNVYGIRVTIRYNI